jgi:hypothetical protein
VDSPIFVVPDWRRTRFHHVAEYVDRIILINASPTEVLHKNNSPGIHISERVSALFRYLSHAFSLPKLFAKQVCNPRAQCGNAEARLRCRVPSHPAIASVRGRNERLIDRCTDIFSDYRHAGIGRLPALSQCPA